MHDDAAVISDAPSTRSGMIGMCGMSGMTEDLDPQNMQTLKQACITNGTSGSDLLQLGFRLLLWAILYSMLYHMQVTLRYL